MATFFASPMSLQSSRARAARVRLYGHQLGHASFAQVTTGFRIALEALGELGGFVPVDYYDDEHAYPGGAAPIAINTGMPSASIHAKAMGHEHRLLMLAPNSDQVPEELKAFLPTVLTGLLAPSKWAAGVLRQLFSLPVTLVPHGVHPAYRMDSKKRAERLEQWKQGAPLRVLHMTSTNSERKGTKLLLEAWKRFAAHVKAELIVVCRYEGYAEMCELVLEEKVEDTVVLPSDGMPYDHVLSCFNASHVVCQPSRAEGFGLIPLEAKAAGVPVVMTGCTGHADHVGEGATVVVESGHDVPTDDMEGAVAPSIEADNIAEALFRTAAHYEALHERAVEAADDIARRHSWENTTGRALSQLIEEMA